MQKRKYPIVPVLGIVLKICAVAALLFLGFNAVTAYASVLKSWFTESTQQTMYGPMPVPAITAFKARMESLINPSFVLFMFLVIPSVLWGLSDIMSAAREIEFRLRGGSAKTEVAEPAIESATEEATV